MYTNIYKIMCKIEIDVLLYNYLNFIFYSNILKQSEITIIRSVTNIFVKVQKMLDKRLNIVIQLNYRNFSQHKDMKLKEIRAVKKGVT